jgi:hypothetical protein
MAQDEGSAHERGGRGGGRTGITHLPWTFSGPWGHCRVGVMLDYRRRSERWGSAWSR